jgi:hypothetical protein
MNCEFCNNIFSNQTSLNYHNRTAKYCLKIQGKNLECNFKCNGCLKTFCRKSELDRHSDSCCKNYDFKINKVKEDYEKQILELKQHIKHLEDKLENIAIQSNTDKQIKIQHLTKKYVKKVPRVQYEEKNVIYIITTERLKKDNVYILGKASNLTSRLSTYNKSDEHEVVYYQQCLNEEAMSVIENMVFTKLEKYRESANRERFILPENLKVDVFIDIIKECVKFLS